MTTQFKDPVLDKIIEKIYKERNLDFSQYREAILGRRVMTRVRLAKLDNFEQYLRFLDKHPEEMDKLMDAMTINVTEFFRDEYVFDAIEKKVFPELFGRKKKLNSNIIRIWSCACSSGEEPYSVLMLIAEFLGARLADYNLKIFATDIDSRSLSNAREGVYEEAQFRKLSEERKKILFKYFYDMGNSRLWIREEWPAFIDFKYHDAISDAPLDSIDMVLCRNLFIYFGRDLQNKVLNNFYKSLRKDGFLVLGNVESIIGDMADSFISYDQKSRIYVKR